MSDDVAPVPRWTLIAGKFVRRFSARVTAEVFKDTDGQPAPWFYRVHEAKGTGVRVILHGGYTSDYYAKEAARRAVRKLLGEARP